jgi:uncharacterized protein (DUF1330 family)
MTSIEPTEQRLAALATVDDGRPIVMINLLRFREQAAYPPPEQLPAGFDASPCSGREAYARYAAVALGCIGAVGGGILWQADIALDVISPDGEAWDEAVLVHYPRAGAFLEMVAREDYKAAAPHRTAALSDSRLLASRPGFSVIGA